MKNLFILLLSSIFMVLTPLKADFEWEWNTFMGGSAWDSGNSIAVDDSGNVYIAGTSSATWGSPVNAYLSFDAFAAKLNSNGVLQWNTFMGSPNADTGESIAVDNNGNVYIAGRSYLTWGSPVNPVASDYGYDAFVTKLNRDGVLQWNTFMGSPKIEYCRSIAVDGIGNVYVAGSSNATWGSPVNAFAGVYDAFAAKLDSSGERLWNTFMGSSADDGGMSIAVDSDGSGHVYVAGNSDTTWGSPVNAFASEYGYDAFAAKLNSSGERVWNMFMGGSADDQSRSITVDGSGNIYIAGYSDAIWGLPVNGITGHKDAFVVKLNSSGGIQWHTFMGGSSSDEGNGIAVDGSGHVYVAGTSILSTWGSPVNAHAGNDDAFAAKLNKNGVLQWNTFIGTTDNDEGHNIAVDGSGNSYVLGRSWETWGSPVDVHSGSYDAFAVKFDYSNIVAVETDLGLPMEVKLSQNYPNPFNALTFIKYTLPHANHVTLKVYNILGKEVKTLVNQFQTQGNYAIAFDAIRLSSGIYLYELNIGNSFVKIKRMMLIK